MNDAIVQELITGPGGIFTGCGITAANGNNLYIGEGYGAIKGRLFKITNTAVSVVLASSGTLKGRLVVKLDLSNTEEPIAIEAHTGSTLYQLTQEDDANYTDGVFEIGIATFDVTTTAITNIVPEYRTLKTMVDAIYPVGSIYMSANNTDPALLFGGTWEQISGKFLLSADSSHAAGSTGGAASHKLTTAELPAHAHSLNNHTHTVPAHTHSASTASSGAHTHSIPRWMQATPTADGTGRLAQGSIDSSYVTSKAGAHTHSVTVASKPAFNTAAASGNTGNTGGGTAISMMPPYLAVYMWKRTA
jgi:microcystin-dependent protein